MKGKDKKEKTVAMPPPEKRAKGIKLPAGECTLTARRYDVAKLPENLAGVYRKVEGKKDGVRLASLCPRSPAGRYVRWLVRTLINLGALAAKPEPKAAKVAKPRAEKAKKSSGQKSSPVAKAA